MEVCKMDIKINVENSKFINQSSIIGHVNEQNETNLDNILMDLRAMKEKAEFYQDIQTAIRSLELAIKEKQESKIRTIVKKYSNEFLSSFFLSIATDCVKQAIFFWLN